MDKIKAETEKGVRRGRGPRAEDIEVSEKQRDVLKRLSRGQQTAQSLARRVAIILQASAHERNSHIAQALGIQRRQVIRWRGRWQQAKAQLEQAESEGDKVLEGCIREVLADAERSGSPGTFEAEAVCKIVAIACEEPTESGHSFSH